MRSRSKRAEPYFAEKFNDLVTVSPFASHPYILLIEIEGFKKCSMVNQRLESVFKNV